MPKTARRFYIIITISYKTDELTSVHPFSNLKIALDYINKKEKLKGKKKLNYFPIYRAIKITTDLRLLANNKTILIHQRTLNP